MKASRVLNKLRSIADNVLGRTRDIMERVGLITPIPFKVIYQATFEEYDIPYPINFKEEDKSLFHSEHQYKTSSTTRAEIIELKDVGLTHEGVVFKGMRTLGWALPHPVFKNKYGWLYILGKKISSKKTYINNSHNYILVYDHWSMVNYYHWMVDSLPRIMLAQQNVPEAIVLVPKDAPHFIIKSLSYFGVRELRYVDKKEVLNFEKLWVQNYAAAPGHQHRSLLKLIKPKMLVKSNSIVSQAQRIYVSRAKQVKRRIQNEEDVVKVLLEYGFKILYFEDYSLEEQMDWMRGAEILVSSHGANLTNMLFMPEKATIFELIRNDKPNFCYWSMSNMLDFDYYYQLCEPKSVDDINVNIELFRENLSRIIK